MRVGTLSALIVIVSISMLVTLTAHASGVTVDEVISFCQSGQPSDGILSEIRQRGLDFEPNSSVIKRLVDHGVPNDVLQVILSDPSPQAASESVIFEPSSAQTGIAIFTTPSGMNVSIDGKYLGVTPFLSNKIKPGTHYVLVEHPLYFTREEKIELQRGENLERNWIMEAKEPFVLVSVNVDGDDSYPWSWIVRGRENCPAVVTAQLIPWKGKCPDGQAVFVLSQEDKRTFRGEGTACLEIFLWRGEVRKDLPIRDLPPCTARYFITNVQIGSRETVEIQLNVEVNKLDPTHPNVTVDADDAIIVETSDKEKPVDPRELKNRLLEDLDLILK